MAESIKIGLLSYTTYCLYIRFLIDGAEGFLPDIVNKL